MSASCLCECLKSYLLSIALYGTRFVSLFIGQPGVERISVAMYTTFHKTLSPRQFSDSKIKRELNG